MKKLAIVFAVGAAALYGRLRLRAADNAVRSKSSTDAAQGFRPTCAARHMPAIAIGVAFITITHWRHRHYRPYYGSYNYYGPRRGYYRSPRYYGGGPGITFSFGSGGHRGWVKRGWDGTFPKARRNAGFFGYDQLTTAPIDRMALVAGITIRWDSRRQRGADPSDESSQNERAT